MHCSSHCLCVWPTAQWPQSLGAGERCYSNAAGGQYSQCSHIRPTQPATCACSTSRRVSQPARAALSVFPQTLLLTPSPSFSTSPSASSDRVAVAHWQQLSSVSLLLTLLGDGRLSRDQCPSPSCISTVLLCIARFTDTLTLTICTAPHRNTESASDTSRDWHCISKCWVVILRLCCCLVQQEQVSSNPQSIRFGCQYQSAAHSSLRSSRAALFHCLFSATR